MVGDEPARAREAIAGERKVCEGRSPSTGARGSDWDIDKECLRGAGTSRRISTGLFFEENVSRGGLGS